MGICAINGKEKGKEKENSKKEDKEKGKEKENFKKKVPITGPTLKKLREKLKLSQGELGEKLGYSQPHISQLEKKGKLSKGVMMSLKRWIHHTPRKSATVRVPKSGPALKKLLNSLESQGVTRKEIASSCGINITSLVQYEADKKLSARFKLNLRFFLIKLR